MAKNQFIVPTHPTTTFVKFLPVTTPEQAWPVTGLFDLPFGESVAIGLSDLEAAMAKSGNNNLVIFGHSQSSVIVNLEKRRLAEQFPLGTPAPDVDFVTIGTLNLPNGGVMTRLWGLYLPFVDFYFNGPAPTDTQFDTDIITQRWDGFADFPIYPIILPSVVNAVAGFFYTHEDYEAVTLAPDPSKYFVGEQRDTEYYFFETKDLPLYAPLRGLGVPERLIDVIEPLSIFVVELGYRRDIKPWVPSPARLIPIHNPFKVAGDLLEAVDETIDNTWKVLGSNATEQSAGPRLDGAPRRPRAHRWCSYGTNRQHPNRLRWNRTPNPMCRRTTTKTPPPRRTRSRRTSARTIPSTTTLAAEADDDAEQDETATDSLRESPANNDDPSPSVDGASADDSSAGDSSDADGDS